MENILQLLQRPLGDISCISLRYDELEMNSIWQCLWTFRTFKSRLGTRLLLCNLYSPMLTIHAMIENVKINNNERENEWMKVKRMKTTCEEMVKLMGERQMSTQKHIRIFYLRHAEYIIIFQKNCVSHTICQRNKVINNTHKMSQNFYEFSN